MDDVRPPLLSPSGRFFSSCLDVCSDGQHTEDIVPEDRGRTCCAVARTGNAQPSRGGLSPQYFLFDSASYDTSHGTIFGAIPSGEHTFSDADYLCPPSQEDLDAFPGSLDDIPVAYPSLPLSGHIRSNTPSPFLESHEKRAYRSPGKHARSDGFQFLGSESAALQYLSSSPPPQSSSPFPQTSPPSDDWWSSICLASTDLDTIQEEDSCAKLTDVPILSGTPNLSPDSPHSHHSTSSTFDKHSSKTSLTSRSSHSRSSSHLRSVSPDRAHTNTDYDFDDTYDRDDEFTIRLHELLLEVARERQRELEEGPDAISPPCDSRGYELSSLRTGMLQPLPRMVDDEYHIYARSPSPPARDNYVLKSATFTSSPTLYSPSAFSPSNPSYFVHEEYQYDSASDTEIDTLVFASPSCSPPARTLKRPRSLFLDQTDLDNLSFKCKLRKIRSSVFSSSTSSNNTPTPKTAAKDQGPFSRYRIIKTPSTFLAERKLHHNHQDESDVNDERPAKIARIKSNYDTSSASRNFARGPASLRRAASLRSSAESEPDDNENRTPTVNGGIGLVPTVPATPQTLAHARSQVHGYDPKRRALGRQVLESPSSPVPIIAPPVDHMPRLPLSGEANAKVRLERLLEREQRAREADGLDDMSLGVRRNVNSEDCASEDSGDEDTNVHSDVVHHSPKDWEVVLGVGEQLRREVIQWILEVLPVSAPSSRASSCTSRSSSCTSSCSSLSSRSESSSSSSTSSSSLSSTSTSPDCNTDTKSNLLDQLSTSPETRFHAAYMFLRYFHLVFGGSSRSYDDSEAKAKSQKVEERVATDIQWGNDNVRLSKSVNGWELATWDVGVACLALSVKFHRDFLNPLLPIYAYEFQALAPHHLSYEDLETSQRDILAAFSYSLGTTPQSVLDELWVALPSLRQLFDYHGGWSCVMKETWWRLFEAILEPDVLRFPMSLLTVAVLTDAIHVSLILKYEYQAKWNAEMARRRRYKNGSGLKFVAEEELKMQAKRERRAEREAEGVVQDVQAVLRISDAGLRECRCWLSEVLD